MRSAFAVLRLVTNSNLVGSSTGKGAADLTRRSSISKTRQARETASKKFARWRWSWGPSRWIMRFNGEKSRARRESQHEANGFTSVHFTRGPWAAHHVCRY